MKRVGIDLRLHCDLVHGVKALLPHAVHGHVVNEQSRRRSGRGQTVDVAPCAVHARGIPNVAAAVRHVQRRKRNEGAANAGAVCVHRRGKQRAVRQDQLRVDTDERNALIQRKDLAQLPGGTVGIRDWPHCVHAHWQQLLPRSQLV